jgi:NADH-quinone oxidoreductase subunit F
MDLHLIPGAAPTAAERAAVDELLATQRPLATGSMRHLLLPALQAVQACEGWIGEGALNYICERLTVPPAEAYGVASFYALLSLAPRPRTVVHVCDDVACRPRGAESLCRALASALGEAGTPARGGNATWERSPCLGLCERAPAVFCQTSGEPPSEWTLGHATVEHVLASLEGQAPEAISTAAAPAPPHGHRLRLLARVGKVNPESLDAYRASGGYEALRRALRLGPEGVIREILDAALVGRGGAAFPTARKWEAVARSPVRPHYLVCNADESEPGTFKDRVLMEEDPFALVESMTIAAFATGCETGYLYVRGEYPLATRRLAHALGQARARGYLGDDILGHGVRFDVELRRGAGAYICGEETALFNSIEGFRGEPRNKPPFPVHVGLFGKPTVVNNVETLVNLPDILIDGGPAFARVGTGGSTGTKLFCVSGCASRPGVYEVPFGTTLRHLIDLAGGVAGGRALQAVLLGGAAGVFLRPDELELPLTFEGARQADATLGSGVVLLFDDRVDLSDIVLRIAAFFRDESCGQCVPCRVGTVRQDEALRRLAAGHTTIDHERNILDDLAHVMRESSICGLGHTAASAVQSAIRKYDLFSGAGGLR